MRSSIIERIMDLFAEASVYNAFMEYLFFSKDLLNVSTHFQTIDNLCTVQFVSLVFEKFVRNL